MHGEDADFVAYQRKFGDSLCAITFLILFRAANLALQGRVKARFRHRECPHREVNPILLPDADAVPIFVDDRKEIASDFPMDVPKIGNSV